VAYGYFLSLEGGGEMSELRLLFASNGELVKVSRYRAERYEKPFLTLSAELLRRRSKDVRAALNKLNNYVRRNLKLSEERDPGWTEYRRIMTELQGAGDSLRTTLLPNTEPGRALAQTINSLTNRLLAVECTDEDVTPPLGFVFEGRPGQVQGAPCRAHFSGFWLSRFPIHVRVQGGGCEPEELVVEPIGFKALYALHRPEYEDAAENLSDIDRRKLTELLTLPMRQHYDWDSAEDAWTKGGSNGNVVFILAHSDGDRMVVEDLGLDSSVFARRFSRCDTGPATVLILNCCMSAAGGEGASLLSVIARPGFSGLIGTEAEILNTHALRCGTRLMWDMCFGSRTLGQAFDEMQSSDDPDVFPLNLFYSCYADRDFRINGALAH
jgi:hypothetical protein